MKIRLKTKEDIRIMSESGKMLSETLQFLKEQVEIGITTEELDKKAEEFIRSFNNGAKPAFKGYHGFPATICASVNDAVVHGEPSNYELKNGDIISIDCGVLYENFYSDSAITVPVGEVNSSTQKLLDVTLNSLNMAIDALKPGLNFKEIARTVQEYVEKNGFSVVRDLVGHGIGRNLHEDPQIPNFVPSYPLPNIKNGMAFCIEPMVNMGNYEVTSTPGNSTIKTKDGSLSAHFEKTIVIWENETIVLTPYY